MQKTNRLVEAWRKGPGQAGVPTLRLRHPITAFRHRTLEMDEIGGLCTEDLVISWVTLTCQSPSLMVITTPRFYCPWGTPSMCWFCVRDFWAMVPRGVGREKGRPWEAQARGYQFLSCDTSYR